VVCCQQRISECAFTRCRCSSADKLLLSPVGAYACHFPWHFLRVDAAVRACGRVAYSTRIRINFSPATFTTSPTFNGWGSLNGRVISSTLGFRAAPALVLLLSAHTTFFSIPVILPTRNGFRINIHTTVTAGLTV
jgi:hypothetical protein